MSPANHQFASYLRQRRKALGLTMPQIAELVGVSKSNVHVWEAGTFLPKPAILDRLAAALQVSEEDLLAGGYTQPSELPTYSPYFRLKYGHLPEEAIRELEAHVAEIEQKYPEGDGDRP